MRYVCADAEGEARGREYIVKTSGQMNPQVSLSVLTVYQHIFKGQIIIFSKLPQKRHSKFPQLM